MSTASLVSLGYQGRTVDELVAQLVSQEVRVLVDVRLTPLSRKPGLSKKRLAAALAEASIAYVHLPALGNPKDNRAPFRAGAPDGLARFESVLRGADGESALRHVAELLDDGTVALLCFEREHSECHRHMVATELRRAVPDLRLVEV